MALSSLADQAERVRKCTQVWRCAWDGVAHHFSGWTGSRKVASKPSVTAAAAQVLMERTRPHQQRPGKLKSCRGPVGFLNASHLRNLLRRFMQPVALLYGPLCRKTRLKYQSHERSGCPLAPSGQHLDELPVALATPFKMHGVMILLPRQSFLHLAVSCPSHSSSLIS